MYIKKLNNDGIKQYKVSLNKCISQLISHEEESKERENKTIKIYENMLKYTQDGTAIILGAVNDSELLGFIWAYKINNITAHINYFCVSSDNRNCGLGSLLLKEIEREIIKNYAEIKQIELLVYATNAGAINFYEKNGYLQSSLIDEKIRFIKDIGE